MTLYHGTRHPYRPGDSLVSGGIVKGCVENPFIDPPENCGCDAGCDGRRMIWATSSLDEATWATKRTCECGRNEESDHQPRIFEVELEEPELDPNSPTGVSLMGPAGCVVREVELPLPAA
jgi:hypothetical protein